MQPVKIAKFAGLFPRLPPTDLPDGGATEAQNIDFNYTDQLVSIKTDFNLKILPFACQQIWSEDGLRFYAWREDTDPVISPLGSGVANDRLYYTSAMSGFNVTLRSLASSNVSNPSTVYSVGVPRPSKAPVVTVVLPALPVGAPPTAAELQVEADKAAAVPADPAATYAARLKVVTDQSAADLAAAQSARDTTAQASAQIYTETRAYVYTYANSYNEEGPPSDATVVNVQTVSINNVTTYSTVTVQVQFDGSGSYLPIDTARVYHTGDGTTSDYLYAMSITGSAGTVSAPDTTVSAGMGAALEYYDSYPPPSNLQGLIYLGNGILAAWRGNEMWFSDAYRPWSWPPSYVIVFKYAVVGACPVGTGCLVTTVGRPVLVSGVSPDAMSQTNLDIQQAGVSKWSIINIQGMLYYASQEGIVGVNGGQPDMSMSERFFTRETWRTRCNNALSTMQFAYYGGKLVVFSRTNAFMAFMIHLNSGNLVDLPNLVAQCSSVLVTSDQMYTVNGNFLNQFGGGSPAQLSWKSDQHIFQDPTLFAIAQADCSGTFTINFYQGGGVLGFSQQVTTGNTVFRLPSEPYGNYPGLPISDIWQVEIIGTGTFKKLKLAQSGRGLGSV